MASILFADTLIYSCEKKGTPLSTTLDTEKLFSGLLQNVSEAAGTRQKTGENAQLEETLNNSHGSFRTQRGIFNNQSLWIG